MSRKFIVNLIAAIVVGIIAGTAIIFAWYTNTKKIAPVEIDTNGISISYTINSDSTMNVDNYDIENISFFDVNSPNEAFYLPSMAINLKFSFVNYSTSDVNVTLMQNTQIYTLGTEVQDGLIKVYKYNLANISKNEFDKTKHFVYDNDTFTYSKVESFVTGTNYYDRTLMFSASLTIENGKIQDVDLDDVPDGKLYYSTIENEGNGFAVEEYVEILGLTESEFNANGAKYYILDGDEYVLSKTFNRASYYEKKTVAYLSELTIDNNNVTKVSYSVTGSYVTCVIADASKLINQNSKLVLPNVADADRYTTSVKSYLENNSISHSFTTSTKLSKGALSTAGGKTDIYVFVYGVQPYDGATNNFLNNKNNKYPITLIIKAE